MATTEQCQLLARGCIQIFDELVLFVDGGVLHCIFLFLLLFQLVPSGSLTRAQAADLTHADVLQMVPSDARPAAEACFDRFCTAFNATMPLLHPNLFECTPNPFLDAERRVDLSGLGCGGPGMGRDISLAFSLPSRQSGETDARGLCTLQMIDILASSHNDLLTALTASYEHGLAESLADSNAREGGGEASLSAAITAAESVDQAAAEAQEEAGAGRLDSSLELQLESSLGASLPPLQAVELLELLPQARALGAAAQEVTCRTPQDIVCDLLLVYKRERDLLPLLFAFAEQPLSYSDEGESRA